MNMRIILFLITLLNLAILPYQVLLCQTEVEMFVPGSRSVGFGGSLVVLARDPSTIFWNPAALSGLKDREILMSLNQAFAYNFIGLTQHIPMFGTFGAALARITTTTDSLSSSVSRGTASWGYEVANAFSLGTNFNIEKRNDELSASASVALFLGNTRIGTFDRPLPVPGRATTLDKLSFGITLNNLALNGRNFETSARFGLSYLFPAAGILFNSGLDVNKGNDSTHLGLGVRLSRRFTLFSGVENLDFDNLGVGLGFSEDIFSFDLAYANNQERFILTISVRISQHPRRIAANHYKSGEAYVKQRKFKLAVQEFKKYLSFKLMDERDLTVQKAIDALEKRELRTRFLADSLYAVSRKLMAKDDKQKLYAALILNRVMELEPNSIRARRNLQILKPVIDDFIANAYDSGVQQFNSGDYADAKKTFKQVLVFDKDNEEASKYITQADSMLSAMAEEYFFRGVGYYQQKKYAQAEKQFSLALEANPEFKEAATYLDRTKAKFGEIADQEARLLQSAKALERKKNYVDAVKKYLEVLNLDQDNGVAKRRIAVLKPKIEVFVENKFQEGLRAYRNENFTAAESALLWVLSIDPKHLAAKRNLAKLRNERAKKVQDYLEQAEAHFQNRRWEEALAYYEKTLKLSPKDSKAQKGKQATESQLQIVRLFEQGQKQFQAKNYAQAAETYRQILKLEPNNVSAQTELNKCTAIIGEMAENLFNAGMKLFTLEKYRDAIRKWDEVLRLEPHHKRSLEYIKQAQQRIRALESLRPNE